MCGTDASSSSTTRCSRPLSPLMSVEKHTPRASASAPRHSPTRRWTVGYPTRRRRGTCPEPLAPGSKKWLRGLGEAPGPVLEEIQDGRLDLRLETRAREGCGVQVADRAVDRVPRPELVEDTRIDVGGSTDGGRVAEILRDLLHGAGDRPLPGGFRLRARAGDVALRHEQGGEHGRVPGAEVLGREGSARDLADVLVDVARAHIVPTILRSVREELRASAPPAFERPHDLRDARVDDRLDAMLAALRDEVEDHLVAVDLRVLLPHRREPVGTVLLGVGFRADPEEASVEEPCRAGQH